jgi:hypothetical protein
MLKEEINALIKGEGFNPLSKSLFRDSNKCLLSKPNILGSPFLNVLTQMVDTRTPPPAKKFPISLKHSVKYCIVKVTPDLFQISLNTLPRFRRIVNSELLNCSKKAIPDR